MDCVLRLEGTGREGSDLDDKLIEQIRDAHEQSMDAARPAAVEAAHAAGRLTARERMATLLDPDSFVEYGALAGETTEADDASPADGLVAGSGLIDGEPVLAASYDQSVHRGTQSARNQRKLSRLIYLANTHRWPFVCFVDGDGARPDEPLRPPPIVASTGVRWDLYDGLAELSGWAPTVAIVSGRSIDGHAGIAMLSDFVVATQDSAFGSWGPDVVEGEPTVRSVADYAASGDVHLLVDDEATAIDAARHYLGYFLQDFPDGEVSPTHDEMRSFIPDDRRRPYDMRKVIAAFADAGSVLELSPGWGRAMLTAFARLGGRSVGIFANQPASSVAGAIDSDAADKAARFVELCDAYEFPLISFVDNPGYMVGPQAERDGMARHHARPLSALHHRTVPLYSVQLRKAYGLGPSAMSGFGASRVVPELRLAWPSVESGGMSLEGAAYLVKRKEIHAAKSREEAFRIRNEYADQRREAASGLRAGRAFSFDDIVDPLDTRERILAMVKRTPRSLGPTKKHPIDLR